MTPNTIEFRSTSDNTWVMRITADRRIEVNEDVDVTEAAQKVLEAMQWMLKRQWVGLDPEEIRTTDHHMVEGAYQYSFKQGAEWAEKRLKEKNAGI